MMNSNMQMFSHLRLFLPFLLLLLSVTGQIGIQAEARLLPFETPKPFFVFGDSYVDAGNTPNNNEGCWSNSYGMTFPGVPSGRCSDGRVLSDYIATYFGLPLSPTPYETRKNVPPHQLKYGMNFAYGGTGVFDTFAQFPNMTVQINHFENLIKENLYNVKDLSNSVVMLSAFGNDYFNYLKENGTIWPLDELKIFIHSLVDQMTINLARVQSLGVKKIAVTSVPPFGCVPVISSKNPFKTCFHLINPVAEYHNDLLKKAVENLNEKTTDGTTFLYLDLYHAFLSVINDPSANNITNAYSACYVDDIVCENPESTLFWDPVHPTQAGWQAVYNNLLKGDDDLVGHREF